MNVKKWQWNQERAAKVINGSEDKWNKPEERKEINRQNDYELKTLNIYSAA